MSTTRKCDSWFASPTFRFMVFSKFSSHALVLLRLFLLPTLLGHPSRPASPARPSSCALSLSSSSPSFSSSSHPILRQTPRPDSLSRLVSTLSLLLLPLSPSCSSAPSCSPFSSPPSSPSSFSSSPPPTRLPVPRPFPPIPHSPPHRPPPPARPL